MHAQGGVFRRHCACCARNSRHRPTRRRTPPCARSLTQKTLILTAATKAAIATSWDALGSGEDAAWRSEDEYKPQTIIDVMKSRNALSAVGNEDIRFSHLQCLLNTPEGKERFGPARGSFWRRIVEQSDAFPLEFWELVPQSNLTALGVKGHPVCLVGIADEASAGGCRSAVVEAETRGGESRNGSFWRRGGRRGRIQGSPL